MLFNKSLISFVAAIALATSVTASCNAGSPACCGSAINFDSLSPLQQVALLNLDSNVNEDLKVGMNCVAASSQGCGSMQALCCDTIQNTGQFLSSLCGGCPPSESELADESKIQLSFRVLPLTAFSVGFPVATSVLKRVQELGVRAGGEILDEPSVLVLPMDNIIEFVESRSFTFSRHRSYLRKEACVTGITGQDTVGPNPATFPSGLLQALPQHSIPVSFSPHVNFFDSVLKSWSAPSVSAIAQGVADSTKEATRTAWRQGGEVLRWVCADPSTPRRGIARVLRIWQSKGDDDDAWLAKCPTTRGSPYPTARRRCQMTALARGLRDTRNSQRGGAGGASYVGGGSGVGEAKKAPKWDTTIPSIALVSRVDEFLDGWAADRFVQFLEDDTGPSNLGSL
ncbi:hypothetical protein EI94DRAFT_1707379 [Lactarius quietus]|nr:hypothetical protein EI94DRAFT_1707379 [Lactarius quietus]